MTRHTITQKRYLEAAQLFHWATKDHYTLWFTGALQKRDRRTEAILPRLVKNKKLIAVKDGKPLVYTVPRRVRNPEHFLKVEHGLGVTEGLIRFWWANMTGEIIEERFFYGCGCVPEFGIRYPNKKILLFEFSTKSDCERSTKIMNKLAAYKKYLYQIEDKFNSEPLIVFVLDIPKEKISKLVDKVKPVDIPVFFTDYETFKNVPIRRQLSTPIYIWGEDGKTYPLINDARP